MNDTVRVQFYVQFVPEWTDGGLRAVYAERLTRNLPTRPIPGAVPVFLTVDLPRAAFEPLRTQPIVVELPALDSPTIGTGELL